MIPGVLFYWIGWMFCIIILFFIKKSKLRTFFAFWLLLVIFCSNQWVGIQSYNISIAFIMIYIGSFLLFSKFKSKFYYFFVSFTIMIGYTGLLLLENNSPIWLFAPRILLISVSMALLIMCLTKHFHARLITGVIGICSGELLYNLILADYHMSRPIGELAYFDLVLLTLFIILALRQVDLIKQWMKGIAKKYSQTG